MLNKLGSVWKKKDKNGKTMLSGHCLIIGNIVLLQNDKKEKPNQPDYIVYLADDQEKKPNLDDKLKVTTEKVRDSDL